MLRCITGSGVSARVGGHAAVFGAKNLKALSVIGQAKLRWQTLREFLKQDYIT
jgi:aldehyde:ferredoxin oxidoreductase